MMKLTAYFGAALLLPTLLFGQEAPKPYGALPAERQLRWHEMEMYCLIHFTPTTFQDKEWGFGDAEPAIFNPLHFDANQIATAAASAGFKGLISVAKHHDGFCLWPTKTTNYSVAASPWKAGRGDMVHDFMEATHQQGMKFGVYLSAWDRNDTRYGTAAYADAYREQLTELMTQYGELFTSWHDGANGGDGYYGGKKESRLIDRSTYYAWHEKTWPIVRKHQPMAMIFSDIGPDMRWVGNEKGFASETSWATITPKTKDGSIPVPGVVDEANLTTGDRGGEFWIPAECDVPQRPGWFYHADQNDKVKTPDQLFEIYLKSVGRGANMNLGLAPTPEGILHPNDVKSLAAFGEKIKQTFAVNLMDRARIETTDLRGAHAEFAVANIQDDDRYSYYAPGDDVLSPSLEITLAGTQEFDLIRIRENIKLGQRLDSVRIEQWQDGAWAPLASATSIGANRLIKLPKVVRASKLRVTLYAPVTPTLSDFALFKEAKSAFQFDAIARDFIAKERLGIPSLPDGLLALDQNTSTHVETKLKNIVITLDKAALLTGLGFTPRQDGKQDGIPTKYAVFTSLNGKRWTPVAQGEFSNIKANPTAQYIGFEKAIKAKYIRFLPQQVLAAEGTFSVAEFDVYGK